MIHWIDKQVHLSAVDQGMPLQIGKISLSCILLVLKLPLKKIVEILSLLTKDFMLDVNCRITISVIVEKRRVIIFCYFI